MSKTSYIHRVLSQLSSTHLILSVCSMHARHHSALKRPIRNSLYFHLFIIWTTYPHEGCGHAEAYSSLLWAVSGLEPELAAGQSQGTHILSFLFLIAVILIMPPIDWMQNSSFFFIWWFNSNTPQNSNLDIQHITFTKKPALVSIKANHNIGHVCRCALCTYICL